MLARYSSGNSDPNMPSAEELISTAQTKMPEVTSASSVMTMTSNMTLGEEISESSTIVDTIIISDPIKIKMTSPVDMYEYGILEMTMYFVEKNGELYAYYNIENDWLYMLISTSEISKYNPIEMVKTYLKALTNPSVTGK